MALTAGRWQAAALAQYYIQFSKIVLARTFPKSRITCRDIQVLHGTKVPGLM